MAATLIERGKEGCSENECEVRKNIDLNGESISSSDFLSSELMSNDESSSFQDSASPPSTSEVSEEADNVHVDRKKFQKQGPSLSGALLTYHCVCVCVYFAMINVVWILTVIEFEMMRERFSKLLLGEDMSGCGNGVCTALAISNAITNLCGMLFYFYSTYAKIMFILIDDLDEFDFDFYCF